MDHNVLNALTEIVREKNIDKAIIIESLEAGLQSAARKKLGAEANIYAKVDPVTGEIRYACRGAAPCDASPCDASSWSVLGDVSLPGAFLFWRSMRPAAPAQ